MALYILAVILNFLVNLFLLIGTNQMAGNVPRIKHALLSAAVGGVYAAMCLRWGALGNLICRLAVIALMNRIAFGSAFGGRGVLFLLQQLAITGIAAGMESGGVFSVILGAAAVCLVCMGGMLGRKQIPVNLTCGNRSISIHAFRDTGNTLKDPVTGRPVLVLGADAAEKLTGLTRAQLRRPVETMGVLPGLRLIPYHTIDRSQGMMLGLWVKEARVGRQRGGILVALAPEELSQDGSVQALTGGTV